MARAMLYALHMAHLLNLHLAFPKHREVDAIRVSEAQALGIQHLHILGAIHQTVG